MKPVSVSLLALFVVLAGPSEAQYKAPSQYFRKDSPRPGGTPAQPSQPGAPSQPAAPAVPVSPKFKDLGLNSQFYFVSDTNRTYAWTKISATTGKNTKNGVTQTINGETPIRQ
jgi:hypothetical protein